MSVRVRMKKPIRPLDAVSLLVPGLRDTMISASDLTLRQLQAEIPLVREERERLESRMKLLRAELEPLAERALGLFFHEEELSAELARRGPRR